MKYFIESRNTDGTWWKISRCDSEVQARSELLDFEAVATPRPRRIVDETGALILETGMEGIGVWIPFQKQEDEIGEQEP